MLKVAQALPVNSGNHISGLEIDGIEHGTGTIVHITGSAALSCRTQSVWCKRRNPLGPKLLTCLTQELLWRGRRIFLHALNQARRKLFFKRQGFVLPIPANQHPAWFHFRQFGVTGQDLTHTIVLSYSIASRNYSTRVFRALCHQHTFQPEVKPGFRCRPTHHLRDTGLFFRPAKHLMGCQWL